MSKTLAAIVTGIVIGLAAANVWPVLVRAIGMPIAAAAEALFLALYVLWARGGGPPGSWHAARAERFRARSLSGGDWAFGLVAALAFAATVHAAMVVLFRLVPYPAEAFHRGYDFSFIPGRQMQLLACVVSALSAGVCEETGFRGYMQAPIEKRHGAAGAILVSSLFFTLLHLNKDWALVGMVPIVFGAGVLLGVLAWASRSLVFCMIGHTVMDVGLFAYWWTQVLGTFPQKPGFDLSFVVECGVLAAALFVTLAATRALRRARPAGHRVR
jgi:membrane protease YdiL (CAAX protease family)